MLKRVFVISVAAYQGSSICAISFVTVTIIGAACVKGGTMALIHQ